MDAYNSAISELTPLRAEFYTGFRRKKEIFNKKFRPLYLDRISLLLQYAEKISDPVKQQLLFRETLDTLESMKTSEIQDYFQDECMAAIGEKSEDADQADKGTALIYPFITEGHPVLLLSLSGNIHYIKVQADSQILASCAKRFRRLLERKEDTDKRPLRYAKYLYEQLIQPVEQILSASGIDTLVIVPEGALRLIPFSALHDGRQFLIEKYAVATVPALSIAADSPMEKENILALLSGLSESRQGFPPLPNVPEEVMNIQKITDGSVLQNRNFTLENLSGALRNTEYTMIHMATHAQFGSSPEKTFLLTYDGKITPDSLEKLIGLGIFRDNPVDLLTLSACQTAAEDERAILGLAGIALKSGAGSSLSTLWYVDDEAGSVLLTEFYRQLIQKNMSKAKALQQAQIKLIGHSSFHHPMYWSPFLLIGNRL
ncbi:MAG: CHAT domain-containing protein, partial [Desulfococcaceae bacterium]|jgi:CHAT domain-containing protein|nr:CHAT domain-containing protein [Desulfococcaceae bacterium]